MGTLLSSLAAPARHVGIFRSNLAIVFEPDPSTAQPGSPLGSISPCVCRRIPPALQRSIPAQAHAHRVQRRLDTDGDQRRRWKGATDIRRSIPVAASLRHESHDAIDCAKTLSIFPRPWAGETPRRYAVDDTTVADLMPVIDWPICWKIVSSVLSENEPGPVIPRPQSARIRRQEATNDTKIR